MTCLLIPTIISYQIVKDLIYNLRYRSNSPSIMNRLDPIEELYDMYSEEEDTPRIVELGDDRLGFVSDVKGPVNPYTDL